MNNKGFTVVELLASFTLTMIVMVFLFEIVLQLKEVYVTSALKTKIYDKNAIVATTLNDKLSEIGTVDCEGGSSCTINDITDFVKVDSNNKSVIIDGKTIVYPDKVDKLEASIFSISDFYGDSYIIKFNYTVRSNYLNEDIIFNYVKLRQTPQV